MGFVVVVVGFGFCVCFCIPLVPCNINIHFANINSSIFVHFLAQSTIGNWIPASVWHQSCHSEWDSVRLAVRARWSIMWDTGAG